MEYRLFATRVEVIHIAARMGQPFLLGPTGAYDVALNWHFSVWMAHSP
ncbi:hypothetical protein ACFWFI_03505 [Streptomyces sp. NPDC060209]